MRPMFEALTERIYRLRVPFENIYTAVFLIRTVRGYMLVDCATTMEDAEQIILGAIRDMQIDRDEITHILITHPHGDHAGGLRYLLPHFPDAVVCAGSEYVRERLAPAHYFCLSDGMEIDDGIVAVTLPGHCADMTGYLDTRDHALITGDAIQICGVGRYGCGLGSFADYFLTLDRVAGMDLDMIIASHDYYPCGSIARGREEIGRYIEYSREYAEYIMRVADEYMAASVADERVITDAIIERNLSCDSNIPPLQCSSVKAYLRSKI